MRKDPAGLAFAAALDAYIEARWTAIHGGGSMGQQYNANAQADALWGVTATLHNLMREEDQNARRPRYSRSRRQPRGAPRNPKPQRR